jgi:2-dehydro-3-deoxyglucarate aldolase
VNEKAEAGYQLLNLGSTTGALRGVVEGDRSGVGG